MEPGTRDEDGVLWNKDEFGPFRVDDKVWSMNEIRDHPMFMEDVPSDISDNPNLLALQSMIYDGHSAAEMAEHFRQLGNEAFRNSGNKIASQNALMAYTKGLEMECKDDKINSQLHSNRAAVSLRLKEYAKAIDDCRKAIKLDDGNAKAYYRGAKCSEALNLTKQGLLFCIGALKTKSDDKELLQMRKKFEKKLEEEEKEQQQRDQRIQQQSHQRSQASDAVKSALDSRGVQVGPILMEMAMYFRGTKPGPKLAEDAPDAVQWPVLFLYDEVSQSDYIEIFDERCSLADQFEMMFPADRPVEWDDEGKYVWDRLLAYIEYYPEDGRDTKLRPLSTTEPLQSSLRDLHVPQCLVFHILVAGSGALASFCKEHDLPMP